MQALLNDIFICLVFSSRLLLLLLQAKIIISITLRPLKPLKWYDWAVSSFFFPEYLFSSPLFLEMIFLLIQFNRPNRELTKNIIKILTQAAAKRRRRKIIAEDVYRFNLTRNKWSEWRSMLKIFSLIISMITKWKTILCLFEWAWAM